MIKSLAQYELKYVTGSSLSCTRPSGTQVWNLVVDSTALGCTISFITMKLLHSKEPTPHIAIISAVVGLSVAISVIVTGIFWPRDGNSDYCDN